MVIHAVVNRVLGLLVAGTVAAGSLQAQDRDSTCHPVLVKRPNLASEPVAGACRQLAQSLLEPEIEALWKPAGRVVVQTAPRDVQSTSGGNAAPAGSPAQAAAVPSIQPTAFASANIAAIAQDSGSNAIAAIAINPATLFSSVTDPKELARLSRLVDLTFFFPVDGADANDDGRLDYAGARLRLNLTAGSQANPLNARGDELMRSLTEEANDQTVRLEHLLNTTPTFEACVEALTASPVSTAKVEEACGGSLTLTPGAAYEQLHRLMGEARERADAQYLGLDLRVDTGDPTFGAVENAAGTSIVAGLGYGKRLAPSLTATSGGVRGRLGVRYVSLRDTTLTDWQVDGGLALEFSRVMETQRLEFSAGFEFRYSGKEDAREILRTRYVEFRTGLVVPLAGSTGLSVAFSTPLVGEISPTLSLNMNWQQLLAASR